MSHAPLPPEYLHDALESHLGPHARPSSRVYRVVLVAALAGAAALPLLRVEVAVHGRGLVRPAVEKHELAAPTAAFVDRVVVARGDQVAAGDTVLVLRSQSVRDRRRLLRQQLTERRADIADLEMLTRDGDLRLATPFAAPRHRQEHQQLMEELAALDARGIELERERQRARALVEAGVAPASEMEAAGSRLRELQAEAELLVSRRRTGWQDRLASARHSLGELEREWGELDVLDQHFLVRSPVHGSVEELASVSRGSFMQAGERVALISPHSALYADVFLSPRDIGLVKPTSRVRLQIDAFNYNEWGSVDGRVEEIPADFVLVDQQPLFRVRVRPERTTLVLKNGARGELRKGMTLSARFVVARRSLWQLLWDDVADWLDPRAAHAGTGPVAGS